MASIVARVEAPSEEQKQESGFKGMRDDILSWKWLGSSSQRRLAEKKCALAEALKWEESCNNVNSGGRWQQRRGSTSE